MQLPRKLGAFVCVFGLVSVGFTRDLATAPELWWSSRARPAPLSKVEESSPVAARLARQFNPAMALPATGVWPVEVRYAWRDGADLVAKVLDDDGDVVSESVAVPNRDLERRPWADLPTRDAGGRRIHYTVDAPGDDGEEDGRTRWRKRWDALVGRDRDHANGDAAEAGARPFPPTQYAHLFWFNRAEGLLAIQYWFFYPFNEWINRHEGDWEHVNVILKGPPVLREGAAFKAVGYQFSFHSWRYETDEVVRVGGETAGEDHVMVFVGGRGRLLWWRGTVSGGSYPLPGVYPGAGSGPWRPNEDTRNPGRYLAASEFQVILLPEPERLDAAKHPELSWLRLPFYAGQARMCSNPPLVDRFGFGSPVVQPAWRQTWNGRKPKKLWGRGALVVASKPVLPQSWSVLAAPWL